MCTFLFRFGRTVRYPVIVPVPAPTVVVDITTAAHRTAHREVRGTTQGAVVRREDPREAQAEDLPIAGNKNQLERCKTINPYGTSFKRISWG